MFHPSTYGSSEDYGFRHPVTKIRARKSILKRRKHLTASEGLPESFRYNPEQLTPARNQGRCGSCWAFAITSSVADRIRIKGGPSVLLSPQHLLNCIYPSCEGADIDEALSLLPKSGFVPEIEIPYQQLDGGPVIQKCNKNLDGYHVNIENYKTYVIDGSGEDLIRNMKAHIYHDGPIIGAMLEVYPDINNYDGVSIYEPRPNQTSEGGHAIEIIGWGKNENNIPYWICRNSWGPYWPSNHLPGGGVGWFYVKMGVNASHIEEVAYACLPTPVETNDAVSTDQSDEYPGEVSRDKYINPPYYPPLILNSDDNSSSNAEVLATLLIILIGIYIIYRLTSKSSNN